MQRVISSLSLLAVLALVSGCAASSGSSASSSSQANTSLSAPDNTEPASNGSLPPPPASANAIQAPPGDVALIVDESDGIAYSYVQGSLAAAYLQTSPTSVEYTNWTPEGQLEDTGTETCVSSQDVRTTLKSPSTAMESLAALAPKTFPDAYLCAKGITAVKASIDFVDGNFNSGSKTPLDVVYAK
jgi:hypothetical protein